MKHFIKHDRNKMQSKTWSPVPLPGELDRTTLSLPGVAPSPSSLILAIRSTTWKHDVIHKTGSTQHIALLSEED